MIGAFGLRLMKTPSHIRPQGIADILVYDRQVEPFRVKVTAAPALRFRILRIFMVCEDRQKPLVTQCSANILRWPGAGAIDTHAMLWSCIENKEFFDLHDVAPIVAEVVGIDECRSRSEITHPDLTEIEDAGIIVERIFREKRDIAEAQTTNPEFVEVIVPPIEGSLDRQMELLESPVQWQDKATPDLRLDLIERYANLNGVRALKHAANGTL